MRIFFSVGEPSGDLHAANLVTHLQQRQPGVECVGFGGPKMSAAGCHLLYDLTQLAVMFLGGALRNLKTFLGLIGQADRYFANHTVDAVVLIDFSGFNWWIARKAKKHGIPVFYYGVPQMWAWAPWRIRKLRRLVDHVLCKLPFEVEWFSKRGCRATYIGHPYFDQLFNQQYDEPFIAEQQSGPGRKLLLLPGSRDLEIEKHLAMMLETSKRLQAEHDGLKVLVACYNQKHLKVAHSLVEEKACDAECFVDRTPELMRVADLCLACSGSVSLELLFHRKPTVIVYKIKRLEMLLQSIFLRCKYITLVNLIASPDIRRTRFRVYRPEEPGPNPAPMPEFLTGHDCPDRLVITLNDWLKDPDCLQRNRDQLDAIAEQYVSPGATARAAEYLLANLEFSATREKDRHVA
ncbi:MAG: lipid-A-disaccharide synthase [Planctomycetota bacterium]|nr:lipid-A-disaccharide synthase [Planctomycetota bacterium]